MIRPLRVLMLLTDGFGGFGGISKFNRDFLESLSLCPLVERVLVLPRLIPEAIDGRLPEAVVYDRKAAAGKLSYAWRLVAGNWHSEKCDLVVCGHVNLLSAAWFVARTRGARLALIIHGIECWQPTARALPNFLANRIDALISVSRHSADRFCAWSMFPPQSAFILPNSVALDAFAPRESDPALVRRYGLEGSKVILTLGRLASQERYKGFDEVVEALPKLLGRFPTLKYLVVGDGPDRARLAAKADGLGVADKVVFTGRIPESEKAAHFNLADAFVMPSSGEGFGIVLIEAAACGLPIVGSSVDGSREALLGGKLGRLVDPRAPHELLEAVAALLEEGRPRTRSDLVEQFGIGRFRAKVGQWCSEQAVKMAA